MRPNFPVDVDSDAWLRVSWRARPGSFLALMSLYESNWLRLRALLGDIRQLSGRAVSRIDGDCDLEVTLLERSAYTSVLRLTYLFADGPSLREPDLEVRVYHDAELAEASQVGSVQSHAALRQIDAALPGTLDRRWRRNMLLNKWLEYLTDTGHVPSNLHAVA